MSLQMSYDKPLVDYEKVIEGDRLRCISNKFSGIQKGETVEVLDKTRNIVILTNGRSKYSLDAREFVYHFVSPNRIERTTYRIDVTVTPQVSANIENPYSWRIIKYTIGEGETLVASGWADCPENAFKDASDSMKVTLAKLR